jgi:chitinase
LNCIFIILFFFFFLFFFFVFSGCRNYNYGPASAAVGANILADPNLVAEDPVISFKTSFWFWTTPSGTIPSIHEVLVGEWKPTKADIKAGRKPGFGVTIDIINGAVECGTVTPQAQNRILYFKQFSKFLNVSTGPNLSCANMQPF